MIHHDCDDIFNLFLQVKCLTLRECMRCRVLLQCPISACPPPHPLHPGSTSPVWCAVTSPQDTIMVWAPVRGARYDKWLSTQPGTHLLGFLLCFKKIQLGFFFNVLAMIFWGKIPFFFAWMSKARYFWKVCLN